MGWWVANLIWYEERVFVGWSKSPTSEAANDVDAAINSARSKLSSAALAAGPH